MNGIPQPFRSMDEFQETFMLGLENMLEGGGLGTFILAMTNASMDKNLLERLKPRLLAEYERLKASEPEKQCATEDDRQVFEKLSSPGYELLQLSEQRQLPPWSMRFTPMRALRPSRMSDTPIDHNHEPFDDNKFHFNKSFLANEILWKGKLMDAHCRLLYNKFPFLHLHSIFVIEPEECRPQLLDQSAHEFIWQFLENIEPGFPGVGMGYNAYGAGASVNHQHFHMYIRQDDGYPVEADRWQHNGGEHSYPLQCEYETSSEGAWQKISHLNESNSTYNLLYRPGCAYIIRRRFQGQFDYADWMAGVGWADLAGEVTSCNRRHFLEISQQQLEKQLLGAYLE